MLNKTSDESFESNIELGILVAYHAELLCRGLSKVLAYEGGGRFEDRPVPIDVKAELDHLCAAMKKASGRTDISFKFFDESPTLTMDLQSFLFVFYVLIDNAIKYSDPNTTIELVCDEERQISDYAIKIKSYGLPIPDGEKEKVFQKFWRHPRAREKDDTGLGIGCWSARKHMELIGGNLTVEVQNA